MFDLAWGELAVIAVVALVVIGPRELPRVLRTVGQWVTKARAVAREFQSSIDEIAREADLQDVKKHIDTLRDTNVTGLLEKSMDPDGQIRRAFDPTALPDRSDTVAGEAPSIAAPSGETLASEVPPAAETPERVALGEQAPAAADERATAEASPSEPTRERG